MNIAVVNILKPSQGSLEGIIASQVTKSEILVDVTENEAAIHGNTRYILTDVDAIPQDDDLFSSVSYDFCFIFAKTVEMVALCL